MGNRILITGLLVLLALAGFSQKTKYGFLDSEKIIAEAQRQMEADVTSESFEKFREKNGLERGQYHFQVTIRAKGAKAEVISVRAESRDEGSVDSQNALKDYVHSLRLAMKIPKQESYKFNFSYNLK